MTKYVSLFSGIGGFESGLDPLGWKCQFASEIDKYAKQAYSILHGDELLHDDVMKINAEDIPDHDVLVGGFPCQAFSVAGKRGGFGDARGTLFFEIARIAEEKKPRLLLLENVKGLVSHDKGKTLDTMVKVLTQLGYAVDFNIMNSKFFNVPQNRERIFIVGVLGKEHEPWNIQGTNVVAKAKKRIQGYEDIITFNFDWPTNSTVNVKLRDVLEPEVEEKYYLPQEKTEKLLAQLDVEGLPIREATKQGYAIAEEGDSVNFVMPNSKTRRGRVGKQIANTLEVNLNQGVVEHGDAIHNVYGGFDEKKPRVFKGMSPTIRTAKGGGHIPSVVEEEIRATLTPDRVSKKQNGRRFKDNDEPMFTLTQQDIHGVLSVGNTNPSGKGMGGQVYSEEGLAPTVTTNKGEGSRILTQYRIRKLTPRECFRLQGFTDEQFDELETADISNTQLYRMAGNAVTVNVIHELGKRLEGLL